MSQSQYLRIFRKQSPVKVLGPYQRAVIWVQGCTWGCQGCIVPESWPSQGGEIIGLEDLATWILEQPQIEGITLSGGEPLLQAAALSELIDKIQESRDLGVVCYTGYTLENLQKTATDAQKELLARLDLLIDGLYIKKLHDNLLWRGSSNQGLRLLSQRYQNIVEQFEDTSAGLEFIATTARELYFTGVPEQVNFRTQFEAKLKEKGILLRA